MSFYVGAIVGIARYFEFREVVKTVLDSIIAVIAVIGTGISSVLIFNVPMGAAVEPALELGEIATFDQLVPIAVNMASHEDVTPSTAAEIDAVAHSSPGAPVTPPGLTELTLSRDKVLFNQFATSSGPRGLSTRG
jgi:hypothetical protein